MKLYHAPMTRSGRVRWLLQELEVPCEIVRVDVFAGQGRTPEHRAIHPHGVVPALEVDGRVLLESGGICLWLADVHGAKGLAPPIDSPLRGPYCQWMVYVPATCDPALETILFHTRFLPEEKRIPVLVDRAKKQWAVCERVIEAGLGDKPYILGDTFSAADIMVGSAVAWARFAGALGDSARLTAYAARLAERPAFGVGNS